MTNKELIKLGELFTNENMLRALKESTAEQNKVLIGEPCSYCRTIFIVTYCIILIVFGMIFFDQYMQRQNIEADWKKIKSNIELQETRAQQVDKCTKEYLERLNNY